MAELYANGAKIIEKILRKQGCPKSLVLNNKDVKNKKKLYALVCEALKFKSVTEHIMEDTKLLSREKQLKHPMALVLLYDFLFGKGLKMGGKYKQIINRNKTSLHASLARMKVKAKVMTNEDLLPASVRHHEENKMPRYVRVNTLKVPMSDVIQWLCKNGYELGETKGSLNQLTSITSKQFMVDNHIPNLLVFPPGTDLHDNLLYKEGKIIFQDKASCFPAFVLNPKPGSCVIDACAAPGNKTSHLAAIMENRGKIFAFDVSAKRISTMEKLLHRAGQEIVEVKNEDFLKSSTKDNTYSNVEYILVDPSCSGSGMVNRLDYVMSDGQKMDSEEEKRIESLAQFQAAALSHALSFPSVKKVVYSTCSIHDKENEEVVRTVLERFHETFELKNALSTWPYRGHPLFPEATKCVRASPQEGSTSGFFLALFERRKTTEDTKQQELDLIKRKTNEERNKKRRQRRKRKQITRRIKENGEITMTGEKKLKLEETTNNKNLTDKKRKKKKFTKQATKIL